MQNTPELKLTFRGVDSFNRPVFKDIHSPKHYGATDVLFDYNTTEAQILQAIQEGRLIPQKHISFFGYKFDCEPESSTPLKQTICVIKK